MRLIFSNLKLNQFLWYKKTRKKKFHHSFPGFVSSISKDKKEFRLTFFNCFKESKTFNENDLVYMRQSSLHEVLYYRQKRERELRAEVMKKLRELKRTRLNRDSFSDEFKKWLKEFKEQNKTALT